MSGIPLQWRKLTFWLQIILFLSLPFLARVAPAIEFGRYHALVIGNTDHAHLAKLATAISDAVATAGLLRGKYGFEVTLLLNAPRSQILISLDWLKSALTARDRLLIYYAGHGELDPETGAGYWLPVDAQADNQENWIANDSLSRRLAAMTALHVMVVADRYDTGGPASAAKAPPKGGAAREEWLHRMAATRSRTVLVSGGSQPAAAAGAGGHSAFAKVFLEVLGDNGGILDGQTLFQQLRAKAVQNGAPAPLYSDIQKAGHAGGDFLFVPRELARQAPAKPVAAPAKPVAPPADPDRMELAFWNSVKDSDEAAMFGAYLKKYPDGLFAELAQLRLQRLQSKRTAPPAIVLEPIEGTFVALRNANVRKTPNVSAAKVATLTKGSEIYVPGKVAGKNWFAVDRDGKRLGYVFKNLLQDKEAFEATRNEDARKKVESVANKNEAALWRKKLAEQQAALDAFRRNEARSKARKQMQNRESAAWKVVASSGSAAAFRSYLQQYPDGANASLARNRLADVTGTSRADKSRVAMIDPKQTVEAVSILAPFHGLWHGDVLGCGVNSWGYSRDIFVSLAIAEGKIVGKIRETAEATSYDDEFTTTAPAASFAAKEFFQVAEFLKLKFDTDSTGISGKFDGCLIELTRK